MSKLISNPCACGFHDNGANHCKHKDGPDFCGDGFPTNCPLHDGVPTPKSIEELIQLVKQEFGKVNTPSNQIPYLQVGPLTHKELSKPIRRNRKDCIHYNKNLVSGRCLDTFRNSYFCVGVNCGCFKTE